MKKWAWSCSESLQILHIDESEGKVDIYLNKQFTYPFLFFLCLHNWIFSPLFFSFFFFPPKSLYSLNKTNTTKFLLFSPPPPLLLLLLVVLLPPPSCLHLLLLFPFFWRSVIGGCPQAREGPATVVNQLERSRRIALLEEIFLILLEEIFLKVFHSQSTQQHRPFKLQKSTSIPRTLCQIVLFSLFDLFVLSDHVIVPRRIFSNFVPSMRIFEHNLWKDKVNSLEKITWSELGKQNIHITARQRMLFNFII